MRAFSYLYTFDGQGQGDWCNMKDIIIHSSLLYLSLVYCLGFTCIINKRGLNLMSRGVLIGMMRCGCAR